MSGRCHSDFFFFFWHQWVEYHWLQHSKCVQVVNGVSTSAAAKGRPAVVFGLLTRPTGSEVGQAPGSHPPASHPGFAVSQQPAVPHRQLETPPAAAWQVLPFLSFTPVSRPFSVLTDLGPSFHPPLGQSERTPVPHSETGAKAVATAPPPRGAEATCGQTGWLPDPALR